MRSLDFRAAHAWSWAAAAKEGANPEVLMIALFAGFELGYRSCLESGISDLHVPDTF